MKFYNKNVDEVFKILNSSDVGLSNDEVTKRLKQDGYNKLTTEKKKSKIYNFLNQFKDLMIVILIISSIISFVLSIINKESFTDSIIILAIVFLNAILGYIQEFKADKAIESLKKMQITKVKVKRENTIIIVNSEEIVKGDILILEAGDTVVCDARIIFETSLKVDESSLTGESIPVCKCNTVLEDNVPLSERVNMIYSGTQIVYGKCMAVVCETGMNTEFGLIAKNLNDEEKEITPLQRKLNGISKFLSSIIFIIIIIMFLIGLIKGMNLTNIIMLSISLAVAAIPEGLPAIITIILSLGMSNMAKKKAIVRKMSSVETLGCTEVICSDKTGTITQNKMKVREIVYNNKIYNIDDINVDNLLLKIMVLNNDVEKNKNEYIGDPTEVALYEYCEKYIDINLLRKNNKRIGELPFDSDRKLMSVINENESNKVLYTKGSFDSIIECCTSIYIDDKIIELDDLMKEKLKNIEISESSKAYRVLAYAYKILDSNYILNNNLENELIFVGMSAMIDPPRIDVKEAIEKCKQAHIKPVMITGDSLSTAKQIAKEIGILKNDDEAILGVDLDKMTKEELKDKVKNYSVYARVSPINKLTIVNAWKENNMVVAMTGDGVNDAPALKNSDIGVGMGISGTEVSKGVSDIILSDDSFSTIVTAVKEGRRIFDNIRKVLVYLLAGNIAEIIVVFISMIFGFEIFLPIQLLYLNLITDSMPAISLAFEKAEDNIMERNIRKKDSSFFTPFLTTKILVSALLKAISILLIYFIAKKINNIEIATTMSFLTLILLEMTYAYNCKNLKNNIIGKKMFNNSFMNKSMLVLSFVQIIVFVTPIRRIFNIVSLNTFQVLLCISVAIIVFIIDELSKKIINKYFKD